MLLEITKFNEKQLQIYIVFGVVTSEWSCSCDSSLRIKSIDRDIVVCPNVTWNCDSIIGGCWLHTPNLIDQTTI